MTPGKVTTNCIFDYPLSFQTGDNLKFKSNIENLTTTHILLFHY